MSRLPRLLLAVLVLLTAAPATAAAQEEVTETLSIPTVDGATLHAEVRRPAGDAKVPVILTYSPYNVLGGSPADGLGDRYVPEGYARVVADVLGTRNSSGCWDYGGLKEQQSGVDLVNALAAQPWSSGKVAMIGGSYDGTTANMVAAAGDRAPGLAAIVPELAISRWYGYAYQDGVRYLGNSQKATDEGFDTPLAFDLGFGRTPPDRLTPQAAQAFQDRAKECGTVEHTERGYDDTPDYDAFWLERDYRKDAAKWRVPTLVVHGWQDYNVKQSEGVDLFTALRGDKQLFMFQGTHQGAPDDQYLPVLDRFFARTLKGAKVAPGPRVITQGRDAVTPKGDFRTEAAWPPAGVGEVRVPLGGGERSYTDTGTQTEEAAMRDLASERGFVAYRTEPLARDMRIAGTPTLDLSLQVDRDHGHVTPTLVDIAPDGRTVPISRGFLNLLYRESLAERVPVPANEPIDATVTFAPQDWTVREGHRIAVIVQSSNVVWAVPDRPAGGTFAVREGSALRLPVVGTATAPVTPVTPATPAAPDEDEDGGGDGDGDGGSTGGDAPSGGGGGGATEQSAPAPAPAPAPGPAPAPAAPAGGTAPSSSPPRGTSAAAARRWLSIRLRRTGRRTVRVSGRWREDGRVVVRLVRRGRTVARRTVTVRRGVFAVTFRASRTSRALHAAVAVRDDDRTLRATSRALR